MDSLGEHASSSVDHRPIAFNAVLTLLSRLLPFLIALVTIPITIHGLGVERFGVLALVWALLAQLTFFDFGVAKACTVLVATAVGRGEAQRTGLLVWTAVQIQIAFGVIGAAALFWTAPALVSVLSIRRDLALDALAAFRITGASLPFLIAALALRGGLEGMQRFGAVSAIEAISKSALLVLPAVGAVVAWDLPTICLLLVIAQVVTFVVYLYAVRTAVPDFGSGGRVSRRDAESLMQFGKWIAVSSVVGPVMIYLDRWVIASFLGVTSVAYYTTPFDMVFRLSVLSQSVIAALFPALTTLYAMRLGDSAAHAAGVATKFVLLTVGLIGTAVILLSRDLMTWWLGADFARESSAVLQILTVGLVINSVARIPYATVQAVGRPDVTAKLHLLELPFYLVLLAVFIRTMGLAGAALAWTVRVGIDGVLLFVAARKLTGPERPESGSAGVFRGSLLVGAAAAAAAVAAASAQSSSLRLFVAVSLVAVAATLAHRLVLDGKEREVLRDLVSKGLATVAR